MKGFKAFNLSLPLGSMAAVLVFSIMVVACESESDSDAHADKNRIVVYTDDEEAFISRHIYGQFAEHLGTGIYGGIWVGEDSDIPNTEGYRDDVLGALQRLEVPNVRWPGGCFADEYYWLDGVGPREDRPVRINTHWGMVAEDNSFGTHEFLRLMDLIDAEPVIAMNVGSGTPREMAQWIEYLNYDGESEMADLRREHGREEPWGVKYIGVGNESWGCGGNMSADYYADLFKRFATFTKDYSGHELYRVASGFYDDEYDWTETLVREAGEQMQGISLHYYTIAGEGWDFKGPSADFDEALYYTGVSRALRMEEFIEGHVARMDLHDPEEEIALVVDEWGIWTDPIEGTNPGFLQQQNSLRDALIASVTLDIFNHHAGRVRMANIAQMINVLQAMILTDGPQMLLTPTYHIFDMYRAHYDAQLLRTDAEISSYSTELPETHEAGDLEAHHPHIESIPAISQSVSRSEDGHINITLTNLHAAEAQEIELLFEGGRIPGEVVEADLLTADRPDAVNTFEQPDRVTLTSFDAFSYTQEQGQLSLEIPPHAVVKLRLQ